MKQGILSKGCLFISEDLYKYNDVCSDLYFGVQHSGKFSGELSTICDFIEKKPIFMINELVDAFHVSYNTASNRVDILVKMNIIKKEKEQQRNRIFAAQNYIDIFMESV